MAKRVPQNQSHSSAPDSGGRGESVAPREPAPVSETRPAAPAPRREPPPAVQRDHAPHPAHAQTAGHAEDGGHESGIHGDHIGVPTYIKVFLALMVLLVVTLLAAIPDLGPLNLPIALSIAIAKTILIMLFFMHLKISTPLVRIFGTAAFLWLLLLFVLTFNDYLSRHWLAGHGGL